MIKIFFGPVINVTIKWTITKGRSNVLEDFSNAKLYIWLVGGDDRYPVHPVMDDRGRIVITVPTTLHVGVYHLKAVWFKEDNFFKKSLAEVNNVFCVTDVESEATVISGNEYTIDVISPVATYAYDGLSAYELALIKGETSLTENEWVKDNATMQANENTRQTNESTRQANEIQRINDELQRVENEIEREEGYDKVEQEIEDIEDALDTAVYSGGEAIEAEFTMLEAYADDFSSENNLLKLADRDTTRGMGYKIVRTSDSFDSQLRDENTIYEIRYDFDLLHSSSTTQVSLDTIITITSSEGTQVSYYVSAIHKLKQSRGLVIPNGCVIINEAQDTVLSTGTIFNTNETINVYIGSQTSGIYTITDRKVLFLPSNCVLKFVGGKLLGGNIIGDNTRIEGDTKGILDASSLNIMGTWNVPCINTDMFVNLTGTDNSNSLKKLMNLTNGDVCNKVVIGEGEYWLEMTKNADSALSVNSNTDIEILGDVKLVTNTYQRYYIVDVCGAENVTISGSGSIIGDKDTHEVPEGKTHEWGHGIRVYSSFNVNISGIEISKCMGDAICLAGDGENPSKKVIVSNVTLHECRRQGITVGSTENIQIKNSFIYDINGTAPQSCIDVEPNATENAKNVVIDNVRMSGDCATGIICDSSHTDVTITNVHIRNCSIDLSGDNINATLSLIGAKQVTVENCKIVSTPETAVTSSAVFLKNTEQVSLLNCIATCNSKNYVLYNSGNTLPVIKNCEITNTYSNGYAANSVSNMTIEGCTIKALRLSHPSLTNKNCILKGNTINMTFVDAIYDSVIEGNTIDAIDWSQSTATEKSDLPYDLKFNNNKVGDFVNYKFIRGEMKGNTFTGTFTLTGMQDSCFCGNYYTPTDTTNTFTIGSIATSQICDNIISSATTLKKPEHTKVSRNVINGKFVISSSGTYNVIADNVIDSTGKSCEFRGTYSVFRGNHIKMKTIYTYTESSVIEDNVFEESSETHSKVFWYPKYANNTISRNTVLIDNDVVTKIVNLDSTVVNNIIDSNRFIGENLSDSVQTFSPANTNNYHNNYINNVGTEVPEINANDTQNSGMLFFNTSTNTPQWWNGSKWVNVNGNSVGINNGKTASRPALTSSDKGFQYFDTELSKPIYWTGTKWVDATGTDVSSSGSTDASSSESTENTSTNTDSESTSTVKATYNN